jgi:hypothetical protein
MKKVCIAVATLLLALILIGCGSTNVVGTYAPEIPEDKKDDPAAAMAKGFAKLASIELKADNTYVFMGMNGKYAVTDGMVVMDPPAGMGSEKLKFKIEDGGKALVPMEGGDKTRLVKQ